LNFLLGVIERLQTPVIASLQFAALTRLESERIHVYTSQFRPPVPHVGVQSF
jgi:hypothetical protein